MHDSNKDTLDRIKEAPTWYDASGVPRYDEPTLPLHLMGWICCQVCREPFWVSLVDAEGYQCWKKIDEMSPWKDHPGDWHYLNPPDHNRGDYACVGTTMTSVPEYEWAEIDLEHHIATYRNIQSSRVTRLGKSG
jgi:hypothetical protein